MGLEYIFTGMEIDTKVLFLIVLNMDSDMKKMQKVISTKGIFREDRKVDMENTTGLMVAITVETLKKAKNKAMEYGDLVIRVNIMKVRIKMERDKVLVFMCGRMA